MKAVLMSIKPKWVDKIASGQKTIEVRKTIPKIETPFKCYIYETKRKQVEKLDGCEITYYGRGRVIGEFTCREIEPLTQYDLLYDTNKEKKTCVTQKELFKYKGENDFLYGWHISDLKIYDKRRELSEFKRACPDNVYSCAMCRHGDYTGMKCTPITRPPKSWCYVETGE